MKIVWLIGLIYCLPLLSGHAQNRYADSLKHELKNHLQEDTIRIKILNDLAFEKHFSDPTSCLQYSLEARKLSQQINYSRGVALSYRHTGLAFWTQALFSSALEAFYKGLKISDSLNFRQIKADITGNIGLIQNGMGHYKEALKSFQTSYEMHHLLNNRRREVVMLNNIGDCYFNLNLYSEALKAYNQSLSLGESMPLLVETNCRNIGNVYEAQGDYKKAAEFYERAKLTGDAKKEKREMTLVRKSMASLYLKQGKKELAEETALEAAAIAKSGNYRAPLRDTYFLLSKIAESRQDYKLTFNYFQRATAYKDSIQNLGEVSRIASMQSDYDLQLKQKEIDFLTKESKLKRSELTRSYILLIVSALAIILLLLYALTIIKNFKYHKAINLLLKDRNSKILIQNNLLNEQKEEMITLNDEIIQQRETATSQRDILAEKNKLIEKLNIELSSMNYNLEKLVEERTKVLESQNKALMEYAFINAHKLRSPVANILGLINLIELNDILEDKNQLITYLKKASIELDSITRSIGSALDIGLNSSDQEEKTT